MLDARNLRKIDACADDHDEYELTTVLRAAQAALSSFRCSNFRKCRLFQSGPVPFDSETPLHTKALVPIDEIVRFEVLHSERYSPAIVPWALEMKAVSAVEPSRLVRTLTGGILGCGGWVLSRGANDSGTVNMLFEFERHACVDVYSVLIASGLELSRSGHLRFTELCQCTRHQCSERGGEIASVDLEVQTFPSEDSIAGGQVQRA